MEDLEWYLESRGYSLTWGVLTLISICAFSAISFFCSIVLMQNVLGSCSLNGFACIYWMLLNIIVSQKTKSTTELNNNINKSFFPLGKISYMEHKTLLLISSVMSRSSKILVIMRSLLTTSSLFFLQFLVSLPLSFFTWLKTMQSNLFMGLKSTKQTKTKTKFNASFLLFLIIKKKQHYPVSPYSSFMRAGLEAERRK